MNIITTEWESAFTPTSGTLKRSLAVPYRRYRELQMEKRCLTFLQDDNINTLRGVFGKLNYSIGKFVNHCSYKNVLFFLLEETNLTAIDKSKLELRCTVIGILRIH